MSQRASSGPRTKPLSVVVVEDHADSREMTREILQSTSCIVRAVATAEAAIAAVAEHTPHVVVTDLELAGDTSGSALADRLRAERATDAIALVAVSGRVDPGGLITQLFDAYLTKPVDVETLVALVEELGQRSRTARGRRRRRG